MAASEHDHVRGVYMISVAAELAGMHPQTLRIYESRGLITPKRSPKNTRLYSQEDVRRLQRIQELTGELGMNLAGVEKVFELEAELERMQRRVRNLERHAERMEQRAARRDRARAALVQARAGALPALPPERVASRRRHPVVRVPVRRARPLARRNRGRAPCWPQRRKLDALAGHTRGSRVYKPAMARQADRGRSRGAARRRSQALRRRGGRGPRGPRHRDRRVLHDARALGLGQDHLPADDRRLRAPRRGRGGAGRPRRDRRAAVRARREHGLPGLRAVPAHVGRRERGVRAADQEGAEGRAPPARRRGARAGAARWLRGRRTTQLSGGQRQRVAWRGHS